MQPLGVIAFAMIENGFVHLPKQAAWLAEYLRELTAFPKGKHDDQVDSTAQALAWMAINSVEPGMLGYMRQLAERRLQNGSSVGC